MTIDGIRFVIDSGRVKEMGYDLEKDMGSLQETLVSCFSHHINHHLDGTCVSIMWTDIKIGSSTADGKSWKNGDFAILKAHVLKKPTSLECDKL